MSILQVSHLYKQFRDTTVVNDLSFTVNEADIYGFLGQNGAGKSTTIRMLLTLIAPTSGDIEIFNMRLDRHRADILRQIGAVIERPDLYTYLSGYENLSIFARMSGLRIQRKQLMAQLDMVGLSEKAGQKVKTYSQGMKQRLGIAIALIHDPRLIILDEPTNGLDPQGIADMRNLILHLSHHLGKTVLISSHLLAEIQQVATRMLIIDQGKKMVEGAVTDLFDENKTLVEVDVADARYASQALGKTAWIKYLMKTDGNKLFFEMPKPLVPELNAALVGLQVPVMALQLKNSLEEYFLSLIGSKQHVVAFTN